MDQHLDIEKYEELEEKKKLVLVMKKMYELGMYRDNESYRLNLIQRLEEEVKDDEQGIHR